MVVTDIRTEWTVEFDQSVILTDECHYQDASRNYVKTAYEITGATVVKATGWSDSDPLVYLLGWVLKANGERDLRATATQKVYSVGITTYRADGSADYDDSAYEALIAAVLAEIA